MSADKQTVLIIDDEVDLVEIIQIQLQAEGYTVLTAGDGLEGLEVLKKVKPDLIILDMNMPKMGGIEFYNNILTDEGDAPYSILVLTARANLEQTFKDFNVEAFMSKPFEIDEIVSKVNEIVNK